jgi:biopolymer transport protein ExbD
MAVLEPAFRIERKREAYPRVELTALLDVILLLLIFVLLTSEFILTSSFNVELPESAAGTLSSAEDLVIQVPRSSEAALFFDGEPVPWTSAAARLRAAYAKKPNGTVLLAADRRADVGRLLRVLEAVREAGFRRIRIAVERKEKPESAEGNP